MFLLLLLRLLLISPFFFHLLLLEISPIQSRDSVKMKENGELRGKERVAKSRQSPGPTKILASKEFHQGHTISSNLVSPDFVTSRAVTRSVDTSINPELKSKRSGSSILNSRAQRQPKSESRSNIESGLRIPPFGLSTVASMTGTSAGQKRGKSRSPRPQPSKGYNPLFSIFLQFCFSLVFAASINQITVASHNLHSFKKSGVYHRQCLKDYGGIWFGQELWLSEKQLPMLKELETQFVARSGMENAVSSGILSGRPFGGVSISWSPDLDHAITPISNFRHKRVVGIEFKAEDGNFLLLNVYMPFYDSSNRTECMAATVDTLAMIETIIEQFSDYSIIIGGDMNTKFKGNSPFNPLWIEVMTKFGLASCDNLFPSSTINYQHNSLGPKK